MREETENEKDKDKRNMHEDGELTNECNSFPLWVLPSNIFSSLARHQEEKINTLCMWETTAMTKYIFLNIQFNILKRMNIKN